MRKEFNEFLPRRGSMAYDETDRWLDSLFTGTIYTVYRCLVNKKYNNNKVYCTDGRHDMQLFMQLFLQVQNCVGTLGSL